MTPPKSAFREFARITNPEGDCMNEKPSIVARVAIALYRGVRAVLRAPFLACCNADIHLFPRTKGRDHCRWCGRFLKESGK